MMISNLSQVMSLPPLSQGTGTSDPLRARAADLLMKSAADGTLEAVLRKRAAQDRCLSKNPQSGGLQPMRF